MQALNSTARNQLAARFGDDRIPSEPPPTRTPPTAFVAPDIGATIGLMREHPAVLRALGLLAEIKIQTAAAHRLHRRRGCGRPQTFPAPPNVSPWTRYGAQFLPDGSPPAS